MHPRLIALLICLLLLALPAWAAEGESALAAWDRTLDTIQAWTWSGRTELNARVEKEEARTGQDLAAYIIARDRLLDSSPAAGSDGGRPAVKDEVYRRLAAARTVQYLRSGDLRSLDEGVRLGERFAGRLMQTDFAFWYYYPQALADIQAGNGEALQKDAFALLNSVVLWGEPALSGRVGRAYLERSHFALNLADLVINRAVIQKRIGGLEPLGVVVWLLGNRSQARGTGPGEQEMQRLISGVKQHLTGPESDNLRLNYAVAMYEAGRHRALLFGELDGRGDGAAVLKHFNAAREYLLLAHAWAGTTQGRAVAKAGSPELENMALERMGAFLPADVLAALVDPAGKTGTEIAAGLYRELADREGQPDGWRQLGFSDRKSYTQAARRLWSAMQRHALLAGDFLLQKIDRNDAGSVMANSAAAEKPLQGYVRLFRTYSAGGQRETIPDSAYFYFAECLKLLAQLKGFAFAFNGGMDSYRQSQNYLLQGAAVYPYDGSITAFAAAGSGINTGDTGLLPDKVLAGIIANDVVAACLQGDESVCPAGARESLQWSMLKVYEKLYARPLGSRLAEIAALLDAWRGAPSAANRREADEARLITLGRQFLKEARLFGERLAADGQEAERCRGRWQPCGSRTAAGNLTEERKGLEKTKNDLLREADRFNGNRTGSGRKALEYATSLTLLVEDEFVQLSDRFFALEDAHLKSGLARSDEHPMHRGIRNGYYRIRPPADH